MLRFELTRTNRTRPTAACHKNKVQERMDWGGPSEPGGALQPCSAWAGGRARALFVAPSGQAVTLPPKEDRPPEVVPRQLLSRTFGRLQTFPEATCHFQWMLGSI